MSSATCYRDTLGFQYERFWGEPASFCTVTRNGVVIMLRLLESPGGMRPTRAVEPEGDAWDAYPWIDNADALHAKCKSRGVKIARDVCDLPYGCRDCDVEDCNGYCLCCGQPIDG